MTIWRIWGYRIEYTMFCRYICNHPFIKNKIKSFFKGQTLNEKNKIILIFHNEWPYITFWISNTFDIWTLTWHLNMHVNIPFYDFKLSTSLILINTCLTARGSIIWFIFYLSFLYFGQISISFLTSHPKTRDKIWSTMYYSIIVLGKSKHYSLRNTWLTH